MQPYRGNRVPLTLKLKRKRAFDPDRQMPLQMLPAAGISAICHRQSNGNAPQPCRLSPPSMHRPQSHRAAGLSDYPPGDRNGSDSINNAHPDNPAAIPHSSWLQAQVHRIFSPLQYCLNNHCNQDGCHVNASMRQPAPKPTLLRLSIGHPTHYIHRKSAEVEILALNHASDHPAQCFKRSRIAPDILRLTQIFRQRLIEMGSWSRSFCRFVS